MSSSGLPSPFMSSIEASPPAPAPGVALPALALCPPNSPPRMLPNPPPEGAACVAAPAPRYFAM